MVLWILCRTFYVQNQQCFDGFSINGPMVDFISYIWDEKIINERDEQYAIV